MPSYPLTFPNVVPSSERLTLNTRQGVNASPFSGATTVVNNYAAWGLELNFPRLNLAKSETLSAWLDQLRGATGTFLYRPRVSVSPVGLPLSLDASAFAMSTVMRLKGWMPYGITGLRPGQFVSIGGQLLRIALAPTLADGAGKAIIEINPPLRSDFAANTVIETANPVGTFRLSLGDGEGAGFQIDVDRVGEFSTLKAIEAL